jgi:CBS-domain-containing membrane protein
MRKTIAELMSVDFVTVTARMSLSEALALLVESDSTELCVVDDTGRFEGIVTDFDLLKASLNGELTGRFVRSSISRAVTVLPADAHIDQAIPLFRDGSCSRAYVCRDGRLLGRLARSHVLKHLARITMADNTSSVVRAAPIDIGHRSTVQPREASLRPPQFLTTSVSTMLGGICVERSRAASCSSEMD